MAETATAPIVVCGAHLVGQPLHPFLIELGASLLRTGRTAPAYRMYALPPSDAAPARPGLVRQRSGGSAVDVEVYELPVASLGPLLLSVPPPLAVGHVLLDDGSEPLGFVCEEHAVGGAPDITVLGGWRPWLALA